MTRIIKRSQLPPDQQEIERAYYRAYYQKNRGRILEQERRRYADQQNHPIAYRDRDAEPPGLDEELRLP